MIDPHDEGQLQASLDGALSPDEASRLARRLDQSLELRQRASELEALGRLLEDAGHEEPPEALRARHPLADSTAGRIDQQGE